MFVYHHIIQKADTVEHAMESLVYVFLLKHNLKCLYITIFVQKETQ